MLSDTHYMEQLDQLCLKAENAISAISDHTERRNTIHPCSNHKITEAGKEQDYFTKMGLDTEIIYQRFVEFGSKALLYSYSDNQLCVVYYHEPTDRYNYQGFHEREIAAALSSYMEEY